MGKGNEIFDKIEANVGNVIIGKRDLLKLILTAYLSNGHILLEDVPGTGKTKLAKALAKTIKADYSRIQFTPDLLPSDVTGINMYNQKENRFQLKKGPVFTNILLADEINRATPRTQAGLLECMEEKQVTIDGESLPLEAPFFVIATQNPLETAGTFPLPEAQMDRFTMKLSMGLPDRQEEINILSRYHAADPLLSLQSVVTKEEMEECKKLACNVYVHPSVTGYIVDIITATREAEGIVSGVSPRGSIALLRCCKAFAYLSGRDYVVPDDVKALCVPVLSHRLVMHFSSRTSEAATKKLLEIVDNTAVPTEDFSHD